jgi:hypothetical protein
MFKPEGNLPHCSIGTLHWNCRCTKVGALVYVDWGVPSQSSAQVAVQTEVVKLDS